MKEMTQKERFKSMLEINREEKKLIIIIHMYEPTRKRMLEVFHPRDIDDIWEKIDGEYDKNLRKRIDYDNLIEGAFLTEDEDLRFMLNGETPYTMSI